MRLRLHAPPPPTAAEVAAETERVRGERLTELRERLQHGTVRAREAAARQLANEGFAAVAALCAALHDTDASVRQAAAESLGRIGDPEAVPPLCTALRHRALETREAAARALGVLGDARALSHLLRAQRNQFGGRTARLQRVTTPLTLLVGAALLTAFFLGHLPWQAGAVMWLLSSAVRIPASLLSARTIDSGFCGVVIEAIQRIAERDPQPGLHQLVPELRAISGNRLQHNRQTRAAAGAAARRLEALTAQLQALPVPARAVLASVEDLPHPASPPVP